MNCLEFGYLGYFPSEVGFDRPSRERRILDKEIYHHLIWEENAPERDVSLCGQQPLEASTLWAKFRKGILILAFLPKFV